MSENYERWVSLKEIMKHLGLSRDAIMKLIETKNMPSTKVGRLWKFKISEVDEWMKSGNAADK